MKARVYINYKPGILDPEGLTVNNALSTIGIKDIKNLSFGKCIMMEFAKSLSEDEVVNIIKKSCSELLVNPNTESYKYEIISNS
mgnify:FL=1